MILEEFIKEAVPSDRIIIEDSTGELYRGFVACLEYKRIDTNRKIKQHGLSTDIHRKEQKTTGAAAYMIPGEKVAMDSISQFCFTDITMMIYTKVVLE